MRGRKKWRSKSTVSVGDAVKVAHTSEFRLGKINKVEMNKYIGVMYYDGTIKYLPWTADWRLPIVRRA